MTLSRELRELEDQGIDLVDILGQDRHLSSPEDLRAIIRNLGHAEEDLHAELLRFLTHRSFPSDQAAGIWRAILRHKRRLSERLGRPVRFRVAALDYFCEKGDQLRGARLIARPELQGLLLHVDVDEVTGVYNRRYFNERLAAEINRARRYSSILSLLILDLDDFKRVNDDLGHVRGDALLRCVGRTLDASVRETDAVCRFGGDEFAVLLPETSNSEAYTLAERIRSAVGEAALAEMRGGASGTVVGRLFATEERTPELGVCIGGATFPADCDEAEELVTLADRLCLDAKRSGKNAVRMSGDRPPMGPAKAAQ